MTVNEVRYHKGSATLFQGIGHVAQRTSYVGALALRGEVEKFAYDKQYVSASFFRGYEFFNPVGEKYNADLIIVLYRGKSDGGGDFRDHLAFLLAYGSEIAAAPTHL